MSAVLRRANTLLVASFVAWWGTCSRFAPIRRRLITSRSASLIATNRFAPATGQRWAFRTSAGRRARWCGCSARPGSAGRPRCPPIASRRRSASQGRAARRKSRRPRVRMRRSVGLPVAQVIHDYTEADRRRRDTLVALARRVQGAPAVWPARCSSSTASRTRSGRRAFRARGGRGARPRLPLLGVAQSVSSSTAASCRPRAA